MELLIGAFLVFVGFVFMITSRDGGVLAGALLLAGGMFLAGKEIERLLRNRAHQDATGRLEKDQQHHGL